MMDYHSLFPETVSALYLDDCRTPQPFPFFNWVIVRSYSAFVSYIRAQGVPPFISFDHDLADEHVAIGASLDWKDFDYELCTEATGYDAAKYLADYCLDTDTIMPHFTVHSANPAGAENILHLLNNLQKEQGQTANGYRTVW